MLEYTCYGLDCLIVGFKVQTSVGIGACRVVPRKYFDKGHCCCG